MQISPQISGNTLYASYTVAHLEQRDNTSRGTHGTAMREQSFRFSYVSFEFQSAAAEDTVQQNHDAFVTFLESIGYDGKPIAELTQDEASALVAEDGFFGIDQTSQRVADFVINGAAGNEELLRAGREGVIRGFEEAEAMWGGKLPEISYRTQQKTLELIDTTLHNLGFSIISEAV